MKLENAELKVSTLGEKACLNVTYDFAIKKIEDSLHYRKLIELDIDELAEYLLANNEYNICISINQNQNGKLNVKRHLHGLAEKGFFIYDKNSGKITLKDLFRDYFFQRFNQTRG